jgi:gamma-glutamylcyclotransferase (GGCT)/AIG2-like uncharacterized protein YtfP
MPIRVFVYGTLKQGHGNNRLLENSKFLGRCYIEGPWRLINLGAYPGLVEIPKIEFAKVLGEVYQVDLDTLQSLDWLEGHPRYYRRDKVATPWKNAWAYFLPEDYIEKYPLVDKVWEPSDVETEFMRGTSCGL